LHSLKAFLTCCSSSRSGSLATDNNSKFSRRFGPSVGNRTTGVGTVVSPRCKWFELSDWQPGNELRRDPLTRDDRTAEYRRHRRIAGALRLFSDPRYNSVALAWATYRDRRSEYRRRRTLALNAAILDEEQSHTQTQLKKAA
jgi:hypothetical protein